MEKPGKQIGIDAFERVAIVGGGASGTIAAAQLLASGAPVEVTLIERTRRPGPGIAYSTTDHSHLLNVPAGRMSALSRRDDHFLFWARQEISSAVAWTEFLPRAQYGRYLRDTLDEAERGADRARLERVEGEAVSLATGSIDERPIVNLASGDALRADAVILAMGNFPPAQPIDVPESLIASGRYVSDPWAPGALEAARRGDRVLLIGTGLTMVDVALSLGKIGSVRRMTAVSRGGMLPRRHRSNPQRVLRPFPMPSPLRLGSLLTTLCSEIESAPTRGQDWRDVVDSLRMVAADVWRALPEDDRRGFHGHLSRIWEVHRHRLPPASALAIEHLGDAGRLEIEQAGIASFAESRRRVRVGLQRPGGGELETADFDCVVNCTGCSADLRDSGDALVRDLLDGGKARPGPLGLGLDAEPDGTLLDRDGEPSPRVFAMGPLLRGLLWESTAIAECRSQASALADRLSAPVAEKPEVSAA